MLPKIKNPYKSDIYKDFYEPNWTKLEAFTRRFEAFSRIFSRMKILKKLVLVLCNLKRQKNSEQDTMCYSCSCCFIMS